MVSVLAMLVIACFCGPGDWVGVISDGGRGGIGDVRCSDGFDGIVDAGGVGADGSIAWSCDSTALMVLVLIVLVLKRLS